MKVLACLSASLLASACVAGAFWLSGFNFDVRGETAVACYMFSLFAAVLTFLVGMAMTVK